MARRAAAKRAPAVKREAPPQVMPTMDGIRYEASFHNALEKVVIGRWSGYQYIKMVAVDHPDICAVAPTMGECRQKFSEAIAAWRKRHTPTNVAANDHARGEPS